MQMSFFIDELKQLIKEYTDDLKATGHCSEGTSFYAALNTFVDFVEKRPYITCISDVSRDDIEEYIRYIWNVPYETPKVAYRPSFVYRRLRALSHFFEYLTINESSLLPNMLPRAGLIDYADYPAPNRRGVKHFPSWFDQYVHQKILELPEEKNKIRFKTMMLFIYHTGCRSLDLCTVEANALYKRGEQYWIRIYSNKLHKEYDIPIVDELAVAIKKYKKIAKEQIAKREKKKHPVSKRMVRYLFIKGGNPGSARSYFAKKLKSYMEQVLLEAENEGYDISALRNLNITSHKFRHNVGIKLIRMGADPLLVAEFLGHSDLSMAQAYIQEDNDYIYEVLEDIEITGMDIIDPIIISVEDMMETRDVVSKTNVGWCVHINGNTPCGEDPYKCWKCECLEPKEGEEYLAYLREQERIHNELYTRNVELRFESAAEEEKLVLDRIHQFIKAVEG